MIPFPLFQLLVVSVCNLYLLSPQQLEESLIQIDIWKIQISEPSDLLAYPCQSSTLLA